MLHINWFNDHTEIILEQVWVILPNNDDSEWNKLRDLKKRVC